MRFGGCEGNLERASTVTTEARSHQRPANQGRLTVGGVAAKVSISSCVTQTFPVVWSCDTPQSQVREVCEEGRAMKDGKRAGWRESQEKLVYLLLEEFSENPNEFDPVISAG